MERIPTNIQTEEAVFAMRPAINLGLRNKDNRVTMVSNYLKVSLKNAYSVFQYALRYEPEVPPDNVGLRQAISRGMRPRLRELFHPYIISGDSLYSSRDVQETITITYQKEGEEEPQDYMLTITKTENEITLKNIKEINNFTISVKQFLEIVMKNILNANPHMVRFNRKHIFNYKGAITLRETEKAFLLPGYSTNMVITEAGIFLRAGIKNKFINGKTCLNKIQELEGKYRNGEYMRAVREFFVNRSVMATYGNFRVYQVNHVTFDMTVNNTEIPFRDKDGMMNNITLKKYYKDQYNKDITNPHQPLLVSYRKPGDSRNTEPIYLVPELCYLTGMDEDMIENESLKKSMTRGTKVTPKEKMDRIYKIRELLYHQNSEKKTVKKRNGEEIEVPSPDDIRNQWGVEVADFMQFQARVLPTPDIFYQGEVSSVQGGGKIRNQGKRIIDPRHLTDDSWCVICTERNLDSARQGVSQLQKASGSLGVNVESPRFFAHRGRNREEWMEFIEGLNLKRNEKLRIVLIVLDRHTQDFYGSIKILLNSELGVPSQVVKVENLSKNLSYFSNVLNQMVVKMGGALYKIHLEDNLEKNPTMMIGYDSIKCGKNKRRYVLSASHDMNFSKFFTDEETVEDALVGPVTSLIRKALDYFKNQWKFAPRFIFIYRSGTSEKEKGLVLNTEVRALIDLFSGNAEKDCYMVGYQPKFCMTIVNKRTEAKFFEFSNGNVNNPKEGTVIDTGVTSPGAYEFYLQPQFVNQGTATPTHFHCIYDTINIPLEILENITYKMCYYYWNWPGAIREPACLKFAGVANKFASSYMKDHSAKDELKTSPYFI